MKFEKIVSEYFEWLDSIENVENFDSLTQMTHTFCDMKTETEEEHNKLFMKLFKAASEGVWR